MEGLDSDPTWESVFQDVSRLLQLAAEPYLLFLGFVDQGPHLGMALPVAQVAVLCGLSALLGSLAMGWTLTRRDPHPATAGITGPSDPAGIARCPPLWEEELPVFTRTDATDLYEVEHTGSGDYLLVAVVVGTVTWMVAKWLYTTKPTMWRESIGQPDRPPPTHHPGWDGPGRGPDPQAAPGWAQGTPWGGPRGPQSDTPRWAMGPQGALTDSLPPS